MTSEVWTRAIEELHPELQKSLQALAALGTAWGSTPAEAALRILERGISDEMAAAASYVLSLRTVEAQLHTGFPVRLDWRSNRRNKRRVKPERSGSP